MEGILQVSTSANRVISCAELITGLKQAEGRELKRLQNDFYKKYAPYVYKVLRSICRNFSNTDDNFVDEVFQEIFIICFKKINKFEPPDGEDNIEPLLKGWIGRIGNFAFKKHYPKLIDSNIVKVDIQTIDLTYDPYEDATVTTPFNNKVREALNVLTDRERHILIVYANENCIGTNLHLSESSMTELRKLYNTTPENIRQIKKRALIKLKPFTSQTLNN